jgi:hypothetical protein
MDWRQAVSADAVANSLLESSHLVAYGIDIDKKLSVFLYWH